LKSYEDEHLAVDFRERTALLDQKAMTLTLKEYELLALLVQHAGEIVPRHSLLLQVWGYSTRIRTRTLDVHVHRLRGSWGRTRSSISRSFSASGIGFSNPTPPSYLGPQQEDGFSQHVRGVAASNRNRVRNRRNHFTVLA
jgi:Transcriptional regulatory protein, C terminal